MAANPADRRQPEALWRTATTALRRWRPWSGRLEVVTPTGWSVAAAGAAAAILGWGTGWVEFRVITGIAVTCLAVAVLFLVRRSEVTVSLRLHQQRVKPGDQGMGQVLVRAERIAQSAHTLELPVARAVARFRVPALGTGDVHEELFSVPARVRCVIPIGPVTAVQSDPLGLLRRERRLAERVELFVHPQVVALASGAVGFLKDVEGVTTSSLSSSDVSFHTLRDYAPGDDRRAVHWRTTARTGRLVVRQFEETMRAHLLIVLSLDLADYAAAEDLELAICAAASLGAAAFREERRVSVHTTAGAMRFPSLVGMLDEFARLVPAEGTGLRFLAAAATKACPGASVCAVVTGAGSSVADVQSARVVLPAEVECFAVRAQEGGSIGRRRVGRLTLMDITRPADLARAVGSLR